MQEKARIFKSCRYSRFLIHFYITIYFYVPHFYDLSALVGCWSSVSIRRIIYKFLNVCPFDYTAVAVSGEGWALVNRFNHTSWVTAVTPTDRPKSVHNSCVIKVLGGVFVLSRSFLDCSVGVGVFVTGLSQISSFFSSIRKMCHILRLRIPVLQSKQLVLIRSASTYLRCIADQTRSKYDQPTLYRRPPRCTPAQHSTCGERDYPRPFFNRLKNLSRSPRLLRAGPTNPRCNLDQHTLSPIKARSLPIRQFFQSGGWSGLWCERAFKLSKMITSWNRKKTLDWSVL